MARGRIRSRKNDYGRWRERSGFMRFRRVKACVFAVVASVLFPGSAGAADPQELVQMIPASVDMEAAAPEDDGPGNLYALSAVLMDADTGRVLYEKDGYAARPNASTTKVLTCILALENAPGDDYVTVSANAASQPDVQLNIREGEQYYLEDLLYSLMLKSHNDSAVAIAEHIGGTTEHFAEMMNEKAKEIGCTDTHFVTPNGLDATDGGGEHHTTARDLALIMRYAIQNETFLKITQTRDYSFADISKTRQFSVHNANALLDADEGVLSGKTGFTGNAGYCYVCACESEERTFIISLLGCGWPNNKTYKWTDTRTLLKYAEENYHYQTFWQEPSLPEIFVENGVTDTDFPWSGAAVALSCTCSVPEADISQKILLKDTEQITWKLTLPETLEAPVEEGEQIGAYEASLDGLTIQSYPVRAAGAIRRLTYAWCADAVFCRFFHGS